MHDTPRRMRSFASDCELAFEVAIEGNAVMQEVMDTRAGFARQSKRDRFIDESCADRHRICGMGLRTVALGNRRRDAALRPCRRSALAEWRRRNHGNGTRRQF